MKKILTCAVILLTIFITFTFSVNVNANDKLMLNVSQDEVKLGENIVVSIDVDSKYKDLHAYTAKLSYDKNVFEVIEKEDFAEQDNWSDIQYNKENNKFALINKKGENSEKLLELKLKVKEDAQAGKTAITINNITASDGKKDISIEGSSIEVLVLKDGLNEGESIPTNKVEIPSEESNIIGAKREFPTAIGVLTIMLMLAIIISLIYYYLKLAKEDSYRKKFIITAIAIISTIILLVLTIIIFTTKSIDVNNDGEVNYDDATDIIDYILEIENSQDENDYDVNNDGRVTITDVAQVIDSVTNNDYTVEITPNQPEESEGEQSQENPNYELSHGDSSVSNLIPKKGEDITLDLNIDIKPYTNAKFVIIDGKKYPLEKVKGNNYRVTIPAPQKAGLQDIVISGVVLDNGKEVKTNYKVTVDVLKDVPKFDGLSIDSKKKIPEISVNVKDEDGALKSGKVIITDEEGNIVFESDRLVNGKNTYVLDKLKKDKKYNIKVEVKYDLDSDAYGKPEANGGSKTLVNQDFILNADYGFIGKDYKVTEKVTDKEALVVSFKNSYDSYYDVEYVIINEQKYQVTKIGDTYQVALEKGAKGKNNITIDGVILQNGASYDVNKELEYVYLKKEPEIGDIEVEFSDSKMKVKVPSQDAEDTINGVTVYLTDEEGNIVEQKVLEKGQTEVEFDINKSGKYKVKVEVKYDLGDGKEESKVVEYKETIKEPAKVTIVSSSIDNKYVQKVQNVEVIYTVEANTEDTITSFVINGVTLNATKNSDGTYTVSFNTPQTAGSAELDITKVIFETEGEVETSYTSEYEVLKSIKPVVEGLSVVEKEGDKATLAFTITDEEDTFVSGRIVITDKETSEEKTITFTDVKETVYEIDAKDFRKYNVKIYLTYDLDQDKAVDSENQQEELFAEDEFELLGDFEFNFSNLKLQNVNRERNVVVLQFTTTLAEEAKNYYVKDVMINGNSYSASRDGTTYTVEIPFNNTDRQELKVQEVILNNSQGFAVNENNTVVVFKTVPTAKVHSKVTRDLVDGLRTINASLQVIDDENTIINGTLYAKLLDTKGNQLDTAKLEVTAEEIAFNSENIYDAGTHTIEVYADYDAADGIEHKNEKLGEAKIAVPIYANIDEAKISKYYAQKGEELTITYTISTNSEETVTGITVNDNILPATRNADGTYTVVVNAPEKYGKFAFNTTRLVYANEQTPATNTVEIDVLRDVKPSISNITVNDSDPKNPVLSFNINDEEDTFVSGKVIITNTETNEKQELEITSKDDTSFTLKNIQESKEYSIEINITYDLDSDKTQGSEHQDVLTANSNFEVISEYNFELQNFKLSKIDTDKKVIEVAFESTNTSKYNIEKVYINGTEYAVSSRVGDTYTVEIPYEEDTRLELNLDKVILGNLKEFTDLKQDSILVFKNKPVSDINIEVSDYMNSIKATFDVIDTDDVVKAVYARLLDSEGNIIETKTIEEYAKEVEFTSKSDAFKAGEYTVEILVDYDRVDGKTHKDEVIASKNAKVEILATVVNAETANYYVPKESIITLKYEIKSNANKELQSVKINGAVATPTKTAEGKYEVIVSTQETAGEYEYNLTELVYSEDEVINVTSTIKVDVLKNTQPQVGGIAVDTTLEKPVLSFMVSDEENTFVKGRIVITNTEDKKSYEITFDSLETLSFELRDIKEFTKYDVDVFITYDFDSNKENADNSEEKLLAEKQFEAIGDYKFTFNNLRVKEIDTQKELIVLQFESTNASEDNDEFEDYYVDTVVINGTTYENVVKSGTTYTVEVPYTQITRTELVLEKAILNNLQDFTIDKENIVVVFKSVKAIAIATVADDLKSIKADVTIIDEDKIAKDVYVRLLDSNNEEIKRESITDNAVVTFENAGNYYTAGNYTVEVVASYDAVDGQTHNNETIVRATAEVATGAMIESSSSAKYAQKGKALEVTYTLRTNTDAEVDTIVVNEVPYKVEKVSDGVYKVNVIAPEEAGVKDLVASRINFVNGKSANVNYTSQVEVLKSTVPTVSNLTVGGNKDNPLLSFTINDEENTFVSGKYVIIDKETGERKEYTFNTKDNTSFLLQDIKEFNKYDVEIYITYDFDSDSSAESENQDEVLAQKGQFEIIGEYNFTLENFRIEEVNRENKKVKLAFESTNASEDNDEYTDYYVNQVEINGVTYTDITKKGTTYTLEIPYENEERTEFKLTKAVLDNLKEFTDLQNSVVIFKDKPSAKLNAQVDENQETITANITLTDNDKTLTDLNIKLINPKGDVIETRDIDNDAETASFTSLEKGIFKAGEYTIEVGADYKLDDGLTHENKDKIGETTAKIATVASITDAKVENYYVEKGSNVNVIYTIESNNDNGPTGVNVGNALYTATKNDDGTYLVSIPAVSTGYGVNKYEVSVVMYNGETVVLKEPVESEYYVLKDKPSIENYTFNKLVKDQNITFNFINNEDALLDNAKLVIVDDKGEEVLTHEIELGLNTVELKELENGKYAVKLKGTYDQDEDKENNLNTHELSEIFSEQEIDVVTKYNTQVKVEKVVVDADKKEVIVTFSSTNAANYNTKSIVIDETEYEVSVEDGKYVARIPYDEPANKTYNITGVKVENDIELALDEAQSFEVFKNAPTAEVEASVSEDLKKISATFTLEDNKNTVTALSARLLDKDGKLVEEKALDKGARDVEFTSEGEYKAGEYTIEIGADYEIVDGINHNTKEAIGSATTTVNIKAQVESVEAPEYVNKNETFKMKLTITSNTDEEIESIKVNDTVCSATKLEEENKYEISYTAPNENGALTLDAQNIKYTSGEVNVEKQEATYVLKEIPSITEYKFDDTYGEAKVTFIFTDADSAVLDGAKVVITDTVTKEDVIEKPLSKDLNTIELNSLSNNKHELKIVGEYDLDDNHNNSKNQYDMTKIFKPTEIQFISNYNLTFDITKVEVIKDESKAKVTFNSTNEGNYQVKSVKVGGKDYVVEYKDGVGYALIDYEREVKQEFTITDVTLVNGVELTLENGAKYEIFKDKPEVTDLNAIVKENNITVNFQVIDNSNIMKNAKVLLVNSNGKTAKETEITNSSTSVTFENIEKAGTYTIQVVADYDRIDGEEHIKEVLNETTAKTQIVASISKDIIPTYAEKEAEIEVTYEVKSNTDEKVSKIEINGTKYSAEEVEDGKYKVKYTTGTTAGDETLNVTGLEYELGDNVTVSHNSTVEILKDVLSIENFKVDTSTSQVRVTYEMIDKDSSFVSGKIKAKNTENDEVIETEVSQNIKEYTLNLEELKIYNVELEITYDRDRNNSDKEHQNTKTFATQGNVQSISDYKLKANNFIVDSIERQTLFNANIKFEATNESIYSIYGVIIDGEEHQVKPVEGQKDTYLIEYSYGAENVDVRKEITITDIVLTNKATIKLDKEQSVVIFKDKPQAQVLELENVDNSNIKVRFELTDNDNTITGLNIVLQNDKNELVAEKSLNPEEVEAAFTVSQSGIYNVVVKADFDRVDGQTHSDEIISSDDKTVEITPATMVTTEDISEKYPDKLETIDITYKIESNTGKVPTKVVINEIEEFALVPVGENTNKYKISYNVSDTSQVKSLKVTKVYFGDDLSVETSSSKEDIIEILKDKPTIDITSTDLLEQNAVLFTITVNDPDGAMTSGLAKVHDQEQTLNKGQNTFLVNNINTDEEHILNVEVSYDLDYDTIEKGQHEGKTTKDQKFTLVSNYGLSISDVKTFNKSGKEETYFAKNEKIELRFNSKNNTSLVPEKVIIQDLKDEKSNGIEYTVNTIEDNEEHSYYVDIVANNKAGKQEFKITSVILSGSRVITEGNFESTSPSVEVEVLKDKPTMSNFTANNQENSVTVDFDIKDDDNALKDSYVLLISDGKTEKKSDKIHSGKNSYTFSDLVPGKKYTIKVENNYSLSENGKVTSEIFKEQEIEITKKEESNFRVKNLTITKRVPIGSKVNITFENSLMSYEDVDTIVIDSQEHNVTKGEDGVYKLTLEPNKTGINKLHVDKVKIQDKEFAIDRNLSYVYEYADPKANNVSDINEDTNTNEAIITYQLEDKDNSVIALTAYMKNSAGSIIATKSIELDTEDTKTVKMDLRKISIYSIELRATCDIGDHATYEEKTLFEKKKETVPRVTIVSQDIDKEYVDKKENVVLTFKINTNVDQEVKKISIGDESYKVTNVIKDGKVVEEWEYLLKK